MPVPSWRLKHVQTSKLDGSTSIDQSILELRKKQAEERERRKLSRFRQPRIPLKPSQMPYYYGYATESSDHRAFRTRNCTRKVFNSQRGAPAGEEEEEKRFFLEVLALQSKNLLEVVSSHRSKSPSLKRHDVVQVARNENFPGTPYSTAIMPASEQKRKKSAVNA
uniref:Uncharacterized protein n=1 Tax=Ditylenchus dipsaci TaxID=166011 RepID=A0A915CRP5_9BILA